MVMAIIALPLTPSKRHIQTP